jgi:tetratricopeptide (TPR) repeat protein
MTWQKQLRALEQKKQWDEAIEFMKGVVQENPDNLDVYLGICYLLMNLLVEEDYDVAQHDWYAYLTKKYYDESYKRFSHDPKYLFYIANIAVMSGWYFGIDTPDYEKMMLDAIRLDPTNMLYMSNYYVMLDKKSPENRRKICEYAKAVLASDSPIPKILNLESSLGEYLFMLITNWSKRVLKTGADPKLFSSAFAYD